MNAERRKRLEDVYDKLMELQTEVQDIASEERECFDNMSECLQQSERGQSIEENADDLENVDYDFDSLMNTLREVIDR